MARDVGHVESSLPEKSVIMLPPCISGEPPGTRIIVKHCAGGAISTKTVLRKQHDNNLNPLNKAHGRHWSPNSPQTTPSEYLGVP